MPGLIGCDCLLMLASHFEQLSTNDFNVGSTSMIFISNKTTAWERVEADIKANLHSWTHPTLLSHPQLDLSGGKEWSQPRQGERACYVWNAVKQGESGTGSKFSSLADVRWPVRIV